MNVKYVNNKKGGTVALITIPQRERVTKYGVLY
jgi:hypothetical protein